MTLPRSWKFPIDKRGLREAWEQNNFDLFLRGLLGFGNEISRMYSKFRDAVTLESEWNGNHLVMGDYHLWVDSTGDLRIKSGEPTSDTDGTVVGTQT